MYTYMYVYTYIHSQERVDFLEKLLNDSADKHADDLRQLKEARESHKSAQ